MVEALCRFAGNCFCAISATPKHIRSHPSVFAIFLAFPKQIRSQTWFLSLYTEIIMLSKMAHITPCIYEDIISYAAMI